MRLLAHKVHLDIRDTVFEFYGFDGKEMRDATKKSAFTPAKIGKALSILADEAAMRGITLESMLPEN